jgi:predicted nucleic acid-binding protein
LAGETPLVILDASVVVKWFVDEANSSDAIRLRDDYVARFIDVASVELLPFEVLNALRYAPGIGEIDLKSVSKSLDEYQLSLEELRGDLASKCIQNSLKYGISIYDSSYLSLGELKEAPVYTADEKLLRSVDSDTLRHISKYRLR